MKSLLAGAAALALAASFAGAAVAQSDQGQGGPGPGGGPGGRGAIRAACQNDIAKFCSGDTQERPGRCLMQHQDQLSDACKTAIANARARFQNRGGQGGPGGPGGEQGGPGGGQGGDQGPGGSSPP